MSDVVQGGSAAAAQTEPMIGFQGVFLDRVAFTDVGRGALPPTELQFNFGLRRHVLEEGRAAEVTVALGITPQGGESSMSLVVEMTGRFEVLPGERGMGLEAFLQHSGPALIMPFLREVVANLTSRSRLGQILFPPINVVALVEDGEKTAKPDAASGGQ